MRFLVRKHFDIYDVEYLKFPPCSIATLVKILRVDERTVDDPKKIPAFSGGRAQEAWLKEGHNHRVENGHIKRDFYDEFWSVELSSLEHLTLFLKEEGNARIENNYSNNYFSIILDR